MSFGVSSPLLPAESVPATGCDSVLSTCGDKSQNIKEPLRKVQVLKTCPDEREPRAQLAVRHRGLAWCIALAQADRVRNPTRRGLTVSLR